MDLPRFYLENHTPGLPAITLDEVNSKHLVQVLRKQAGDLVEIVDGKGNVLQANILSAHKRHCELTVKSTAFQTKIGPSISIAMGILKNSNRFEWFVEKAVEIGVSEIIPIASTRTQKDKLRLDRLQNIAISAMLQSQRAYATKIHEVKNFEEVLKLTPTGQKLIAHCLPSPEKVALKNVSLANCQNILILIGPEGDFTPDEIALAIAAGFSEISLGDQRLRTETAGIVAATFMCI